MTTNRFKTLMQREWMQHHRGWLGVMLVPPIIVIVLALMPFSTVDLSGHERQPPMMLVALIAMAATACAVGGLSWITALFQLPSLARRDQQDRSIEFWLSLPAGHAESISATLLMHAVVVPLMALFVGYLLGLPIALIMMTKAFGIGSLADVSWAGVVITALIGVLRVAVGFVLATLWIAPIVLALMAASAWLKRWGVPVLVGGTALLGGVLSKMYGNPIVGDLVKAQFSGASRALFDSGRDLHTVKEDAGAVSDFLNQLGSWALHDVGTAISQLASPHLIGGLVVAAACFGLMVLRRSR
ncbi:MAG TPA: hypothetical protein VGE47_05115 [Burkholderiaceae bacterium]